MTIFDTRKLVDAIMSAIRFSIAYKLEFPAFRLVSYRGNKNNHSA